jgi:hypothetical protein
MALFSLIAIASVFQTGCANNETDGSASEYAEFFENWEGACIDTTEDGSPSSFKNAADLRDGQTGALLTTRFYGDATCETEFFEQITTVNFTLGDEVTATDATNNDAETQAYELDLKLVSSKGTLKVGDSTGAAETFAGFCGVDVGAVTPDTEITCNFGFFAEWAVGTTKYLTAKVDGEKLLLGITVDLEGGSSEEDRVTALQDLGQLRKQ